MISILAQSLKWFYLLNVVDKNESQKAYQWFRNAETKHMGFLPPTTPRPLNNSLSKRTMLQDPYVQVPNSKVQLLVKPRLVEKAIIWFSRGRWDSHILPAHQQTRPMRCTEGVLPCCWWWSLPVWAHPQWFYLPDPVRKWDRRQRSKRGKPWLPSISNYTESNGLRNSLWFSTWEVISDGIVCFITAKIQPFALKLLNRQHSYIGQKHAMLTLPIINKN